MNLTHFYAARKRIKHLIRKTYLEKTHFLNEISGGQVWLKLESQQLTGSFKIRGALNKLLQLTVHERDRGVVTASTGNHALSVAYAANILGINAMIVVPTLTPKIKINAIKRYNVELLEYGDEYIDAEKFARKIEKKDNKKFISGYNDLEIIAGQGTIALEMIGEKPDLDILLVPVGGGGLLSGVSYVSKNIKPNIKIIGVQSEASPVMYESIKEGKVVEIELKESVAEGLHGGIENDSITFEICRKYVDDLILVKEKTIIKAIGALLIRERQIVEGSAAVGVAAILENPEIVQDLKVGVIISGRNIEPKVLITAYNSYGHKHNL